MFRYFINYLMIALICNFFLVIYILFVEQYKLFIENKIFINYLLKC